MGHGPALLSMEANGRCGWRKGEGVIHINNQPVAASVPRFLLAIRSIRRYRCLQAVSMALINR
jgi:hypothetical protein